MYKKMKNKPKETTVIVWKEGSLYIAKSLDVEIVSQGNTKEESLANLKEILEQYFEKELTLSPLFHDKDISLEKLALSYN